MQEATAERRARPQHSETIRIKGFIVKTRYGTYHHTTIDPRVHGNPLGDVFVAEHNFDFDVPVEFDAIAAEVQTIKSEILRGRQVHTDQENALLARLTKLEGAQLATSLGAAS